MSNFKYIALDRNGKEVKGTIEANDKMSANEQLKGKGLSPTKVEEEGLFDKDLSFNFGGKKKVKSRDLSVFCRQFVSITRAGVNITDALDMLAGQTENKTLKAAIEDTKLSVQKGETLARAMARQTGVFPDIMINMVEAGEATGNLETSFERVGEQMEKSTKIASMVKSAMIYPISLLVVIIGVVVAMMIMVIPTFSSMYADMGAELPALTKMLVACSDFMVNQYLIVIIVVVAVVVGIKVFKSTKAGTYFFDRIFMKAPIFGTLVVKNASANFARTLATLNASGISMIEALEITARTMKNVYFRDDVLNAREKVAEGRPLSEPLKLGGVFPNMIVQMTGIGEETGSMEEMLDTAAGYYEEEVEVATNNIAQIVQPLIIVVLAGIVGTIIMAILIPMFGMYSLADGGTE